MAQFPLVDQPIRLLRRGSSEFALSNHVARRLASALIGLVAASAIVLFLFSPRERVLPTNFDTKASPNRGNTSTVVERPNRTLFSAKPSIQARLFPMRGSPQTFRSPATKATILCQWLADAGFETTAWQRALVDEKEWECTSTLIPVTRSPSEAPKSSLFIAFRGSREGKITSLRLKINLLNSQQDNLVLDLALRFLAELRDFAELSPPRDVVDALTLRRPLLLKTYSARYRLGPEISDARRFNLIVAYFDFPRYNELVKGELGQAEKLISEGHFRLERQCSSGTRQSLFPLQGMPWDNRHYRGMKPIEFPTGASAPTTILTPHRLAVSANPTPCFAER